MKDSEIIAAARELISDPAAWTQGTWCAPNGSGGVKMCAEGAIMDALGLINREAISEITGENYIHPQAFHNVDYTRITKILERVAKDYLPQIVEGYMDPGDDFDETAEQYLLLNDYNDSKITKHEDILEIFDKAQKQLEAEDK